MYIKGVDDLATDDLKVFAAEHHSADVPIRVEWIDDTSANIVYSTPAAAMAALDSFSIPSLGQDVAVIPLLQLRPAKTMSSHPDSRFQVRTAVSTDVKRPRAHEASRFYMMHPEHDPRERVRRQKVGDGRRDYRRRRDGDDEHRRRQLRDRERSYKASMYDDDSRRVADRRSGSRRSSRSMGSVGSDQGQRPRDGRRGDFYRPEDALRGRSASPGKSDGHPLASDRRRARQRTPSGNRDKELFPVKSSMSERASSSKELFPNKSVAANLKKELFPVKTSSPHHRRSDAFDAADETADLFATGMAFSEKRRSVRNRATVESSYGRLRSSDPEPRYDPGDDTEDAGMSIRGASKQLDSGVSIRGAAQKSQVGTIRELLPNKAGNAGKELFAERIHDRSLRRNKAEDLFF